MSGSLYLIGEIVVFMVLATIVGFVVGRMSRRSRPSLNVAEITALRERTSLLEREVDELTAALTDARMVAARNGDTGELQSRAAMAEREAEGLERRLRETMERVRELEGERDEWIDLAEQAEARAAQADGIPVEARAEGADEVYSTEHRDELDALRAELDRRTAELQRLEEVAEDARRLEQELAAKDDRIGRLEAVLEATAASRVEGESDAASIGMSLGAGNYADSRLEFEAWDPRDE